MKMMATIIAVMTVLIISGIWTNNTLQNSSDTLSRQIEEVCEHIKAERWDEAEEKTSQLEDKWQKNAKWWPVFLDHQEMDNIEFSLAKAKEYVADENRALALGQMSELKLMIEHLPIKEKINLKNIL